MQTIDQRDMLDDVVIRPRSQRQQRCDSARKKQRIQAHLLSFFFNERGDGARPDSADAHAATAHACADACAPGSRIVRIVRMLMVRVMDMLVIVRQPIVDMVVIVMLGEVQPNAAHHQRTRDKQLDRQRFPEERNSDQGSGERVQRKNRRPYAQPPDVLGQPRTAPD